MKRCHVASPNQSVGSLLNVRQISHDPIRDPSQTCGNDWDPSERCHGEKCTAAKLRKRIEIVPSKARRERPRLSEEDSRGPSGRSQARPLRRRQTYAR